MESSMVMELVRAALPDVPLDKGVAQANTGSVLLDSLPLLTMAPAAQTLQLYWRRRRYLDFSLFLTGFLLALVYHWLHMHPDGIAHASWLGLSGATWRGLDILMAQALLARTAGHALGARLPLTQLLSNLVFPASLLVYAHGFSDGVLTLGVASRVLLLVLLGTLASKAVLEGFGSLPAYCPRRGRRTLLCFAVGFAVFPMPEFFPRHYWLFHSIWHVLMAKGYHLLYIQLEGLHLQQGGKARRGARAAAPEDQAEDSEEETEMEESQAAESECSDGSLASGEGSEEEEEEEAGEQSGAASAGFVYALLQPAARLLRYQRQQRRLERRRWLSRKDL